MFRRMKKAIVFCVIFLFVKSAMFGVAVPLNSVQAETLGKSISTSELLYDCCASV